MRRHNLIAVKVSHIIAIVELKAFPAVRVFVMSENSSSIFISQCTKKLWKFKNYVQKLCL